MNRLLKMTAVALIGTMSLSCTTSFDSYGNRRQTIDPAGAAIGAVALGAIAYSVGKNRGERREQQRQRSQQCYNDQRWDHRYHHNGRYYR